MIDYTHIYKIQFENKLNKSLTCSWSNIVADVRQLYIAPVLTLMPTGLFFFLEISGKLYLNHMINEHLPFCSRETHTATAQLTKEAASLNLRVTIHCQQQSSRSGRNEVVPLK